MTATASGFGHLGIDAAADTTSSLLPVQVQGRLYGKRGELRGDPERRLMAAVLADAVSTLYVCCQAGSYRDAYHDVVEWYRADDRVWPYSFVRLCESLGMAADQIRARLDAVPRQPRVGPGSDAQRFESGGAQGHSRCICGKLAHRGMCEERRTARMRIDEERRSASSALTPTPTGRERRICLCGRWHHQGGRCATVWRVKVGLRDSWGDIARGITMRARLEKTAGARDWRDQLDVYRVAIRCGHSPEEAARRAGLGPADMHRIIMAEAG